MAKKKSLPKIKKADNEPKNKAYSAVLDCGGVFFKSTGETIIECLEQLKPTIKGRSTLTITKGKLSVSKNLYPLQLRKLLINKVFRQILDKQLNVALLAKN